MAEPQNLPVEARRNAPFLAEWTFTDAEGDPVDFTGATVAMQVRQYGAQAGPALITLAEVGTDLTEGLLVSSGSIQIFIEAVSLMVLPTGARGENVVFAHDLVVQMPAAVPEVWAQGSFTVKPGVTDRINLLTAPDGSFLTSDAGVYLTAG